MIRRLFVFLFIIGYFAVFIYGCSEIVSKSQKEEAMEPGAIDYLTGSEQIKAYQRTKSKIGDINKKLIDRYQY